MAVEFTSRALCPQEAKQKEVSRRLDEEKEEAEKQRREAKRAKIEAAMEADKEAVEAVQEEEVGALPKMTCTFRLLVAVPPISTRAHCRNRNGIHTTGSLPRIS